MKTTRQIQFIVRIILTLCLVATIWLRVDWSIGLFVLLISIRNEITDYLSTVRPKQ